jgi:hypothetical protein
MRRSRQLSLYAIAICLAAAPLRAQSAPLVTVDDYRSIADVAVGVTLQAPSDVNQPPTCVHLDLPCLSPQTFTGFGFVLSAGFYPNAFVGIVGESNAYPDDWASYDPGCDRRHSGCALDQTNHVRAALAGVRVRTPLITGWSTRGRFFAQAMAGPQWSDIGPRQRVWQPGAGYDGYFRNGMAIRIELDYRFAANDIRDLSTSRVLAAIVAPFGSR